VVLGTTGRPKGRVEYDVDLVCELQRLLLLIANPSCGLRLGQSAIQESEIYRRLTERKNRCVRLNYVVSFHLDILPACPDRLSGGTCIVVPTARHEAGKPATPLGYAAWV